MISREKLSYLLATGLTEDAARDLVLQGFLRLDEERMPQAMRAEGGVTIAAAKSGSV